MLIMLFALVFIGVGATSLAYGQSFANELDVYCIQKCAEYTLSKQPEDPVGCTCRPEPGKTSLPTVVFMVSVPSLLLHPGMVFRCCFFIPPNSPPLEIYVEHMHLLKMYIYIEVTPRIYIKITPHGTHLSHQKYRHQRLD